MRDAPILVLAACCVFANQVLSLEEDPIFRAIDEEAFDSFSKLAAESDDWKELVDSNGQFVLQRAILAKKPNFVRALVNFGATVSQEDVFFAMEQFFKIDRSKVLRQQNSAEFIEHRYCNSTSITKDMLASIDDSVARQNLKELAGIIDLFTSRTSLAHDITGAYLSKDMSKTVTSKLLRNYRGLFLQGKSLRRHQLAKIVASLLHCGMEKYLLLLITDAFEQASQLPATPKIIKKSRCRSKEQLARKRLAFAIMEKSRSQFAAFSLKDLLNARIKKQANEAIKNAEDFQNRLMSFVGASIVYSPESSTRVSFYKLWHSVYKRLVFHGDLASAFSVAVGLSHSQVMRLTPRGKIKEHELAVIEKNFATYRRKLDGLSDGYCIPSLVVINKDLEFTKELGLFRGENEINWEPIRYLIKFRAEYNHYQLSSDYHRFRASRKFISLLADLPPATEETDDPFWQAYYQAFSHALQ